MPLGLRQGEALVSNRTNDLESYQQYLRAKALVRARGIKPLTDAANPWHPSALELTAAAKLKSGDKPGALEIYKKLADDLAAPEGVRARATEMAAALAS